MMARHPLVVHVICAALLRALDQCVDNEAQPQVSPSPIYHLFVSLQIIKFDARY
jgi:hypothetical protein